MRGEGSCGGAAPGRANRPAGVDASLPAAGPAAPSDCLCPQALRVRILQAPVRQQLPVSTRPRAASSHGQLVSPQQERALSVSATEGKGLAAPLKACSQASCTLSTQSWGDLEGSRPGHRWETGCGSDGASPQEHVCAAWPAVSAGRVDGTSAGFPGNSGSDTRAHHPPGHLPCPSLQLETQ